MTNEPVQQPNRRRHVRIPVEVEVTLQVVFPEETFSPRPMRGVTRDLSMSGMRVITYQASEEFYRRIIQAIRYVKVSLVLPGLRDEMDLHGKIVWVDYDNRQIRPCCTFGISFERLRDKEIQALERSLDYISRHMVDRIEPVAIIRSPRSS